MDACHAALGSVDRHIETGLRILLLSSLLPTPRLPHAHDRSYSSSTPVGAGTLTITATGLAPTPTQPPVTAPTRGPTVPPVSGMVSKNLMRSLLLFGMFEFRDLPPFVCTPKAFNVVTINANPSDARLDSLMAVGGRNCAIRDAN